MNWNSIEFCPKLPPKSAGGNTMCGDYVAKLLADNLFNGSTQAQRLLAVRFCAMIDSPSLYHLFPYPKDKDTNTYHSDTYEVTHEEIETEYVRMHRPDANRHGIRVSGLENLLINKSNSPFLKRLQELDGDKGRYSLVVKKNNYGQLEIAKVAISSERNLCR